MGEDTRKIRRSAWAGRARRVPWRMIAAGTFLVIASLGIWHYWSSRLPCDPGLKRFRAALERGDFDDLYAMTTDIEKDRLGVTRAAVERAFRDAAFKSSGSVRTRFAKIDTPAQQTDRWAWRTLAIMDARTGRSLPTLHPTGEYICLVRMYKQKNGEWRIVMADVVRSMLTLNHYPRVPEGPSSPECKRRRLAVSRTLVRWGFRGTLEEPEKMQIAGQWISTGEPPIALYDRAEN